MFFKVPIIEGNKFTFDNQIEIKKKCWLKIISSNYLTLFPSCIEQVVFVWGHNCFEVILL